MIAVQPTANADYCLLYRNEGNTPRYFNDDDRPTEPRKKVDPKSFQRVQERFRSGQYDGIAFIKDGKVVEHLPGGKPASSVAQYDPLARSHVGSNSVAQAIEPPAAAMVSGFGQGHTNEGDPQKPQKKLTPYTRITLANIRALVDTPQQVDKDRAQWLIPSTLPSRNFKRQETEGQFLLLWADLDEKPPSLGDLAKLLEKITGGSDFEIYTSRSATIDRPKSRALIPLANPLSGSDWVTCQEVLNDLLASHDVVADRASQRPAQLCYLPNRGEFYQSVSQREGVLFDPLAHWGERLAQKREAVAAEEAVADARKAEAQARRAALTPAHGSDQRSVIDAFKEAYTVEEILRQAGYVQRGSTFRHPQSQSGSFSASVRDGRVHSLSSSDPLFSDGQGAHDAFSAFTILMHRGNDKAAMKDAGDNWLHIGGVPWNKVVRREYMQAKAAQDMAGFEMSGILAQAAGRPGGGAVQPTAQTQIGVRPADSWSEPVDPFVKHAAPQFPVDHLPKALAAYCHELSAQSGFDAGGYGFALLVAASNLIDHRARLSIGPLNVPPFLWGGLVASAGAGKSPIMSAAMKFAHRVNDELVRASLQQREAFLKSTTGMKPKEVEALDQPPWKQLIASDTTVEALGVLLKDNPTGLLLAYDELSEFVGRMDAYNGGTGKDRGAYLQAFDGGSKTINRKSSIVPLVVENFSVGVLAGVQPEKLAEMFKKAGGADGLFQRFIVYALPRPGDVDYAVSLGTFTEPNCGQVLERLHEWTRNGLISTLTVDPAVLPLMENYHQNIRIIAQRTASTRLAEHYDKFPGFLARILFVMHCLECAALGRFSTVVGVETFNRAHAIAHVLYRHSEAVYEALGQQGAGSSKLMKASCEAILSKGWAEFKWGDLTRDVTGWQDADDRQTQAAIELLIEFDWISDVTPQKLPGRPGRRSAGAFIVNPLVHQRFVEQSQRIVKERAARHAAIQEVAAIRRADRPWG